MQVPAAVYKSFNFIQRRDVKQIREEYYHKFRWRSDGRDSLLDIGCRVGDIMIDYILPLLPLNFSRIVGVDPSDEMLQYARENFQRSKVVYRKLDIGVPLLPFNLNERFDHITSFFCLHFVEDQEMAMKNIYNLLLPGGDCLLGFLPASPFLEIFKRMSLMSKWSPYMPDVERYKFRYQYSETPDEDLKKLLRKAGFEECQVTLLHKHYVYEGNEALKSMSTIHINVF